MDKHFRLPPSNQCTWQGCHHPVRPENEIQIPFNGKTLLLSLCETCFEQLPKKMSFQSFSGNGRQYVTEIYPKEKDTS